MPAEGANVAGVGQRVERAIEREAPQWGIRPVPRDQRRLSGFDLSILWGDLAIGLLVLLSGALLVPALGLPRALAAIVIGTFAGCLPLALVGLAGAREGVPTMVLFRPVLGLRGSYVPSALNIVQLVGWTGFEFWAMSQVADRMSVRLFGWSSPWVWLALVAVVCTALALGGPILVVRRWLERFGAWVVGAVALWITYRVLSASDLGAMWSRPGTGGLPFWLAVDLVVAQPVSWLPLVADYNRFGRSPRGAATGTFWGYAVGNLWFYALGVLLALSAGTAGAGPAGLAQAMASLAGGWVVLLTLLVGETDEAFADIYSAAVSSQNLRDRLSQRGAILLVSAAGVALAAWLLHRPDAGVDDFESFLFLLGSVFVPLFGVFVADYFALGRQRHSQSDLFDPPVRGEGVRWRAVAAWVVGFLVYQWCVATGPAWWQSAMQTVLHSGLHLPYPLAGSALGASIPSFVAAFGLHLVLSGASRGRARKRAGR
ncbi:MAG TPA: cytosine permease [Actinomycetota bacterium]|jgi:putative hydroxymethylpyrimidine transporter CytX